jgi:hypothetical protein
VVTSGKQELRATVRPCIPFTQGTSSQDWEQRLLRNLEIDSVSWSDPDTGPDLEIPVTPKGALNGPGDWNEWYWNLQTWAMWYNFRSYINPDSAEDPSVMQEPKLPELPPQDGDEHLDDRTAKIFRSRKRPYARQMKHYICHID